MLVVSLIEKAEVDSIPFLFGALGIVVLVVSLQPYTGGLGYRGIAFVAYGKRIWQFSNRLFGGLFTLGAFLLYLLFKLGDISAGNKGAHRDRYLFYLQPYQRFYYVICKTAT